MTESQFRFSSKLIHRLLYVITSLNLFLVFGLVTFVSSNKIMIPNFNSSDVGLLFWIFGLGGSFGIFFLMNHFYKKAKFREELPYA